METPGPLEIKGVPATTESGSTSLGQTRFRGDPKVEAWELP